jgi:competence protein ComFC
MEEKIIKQLKNNRKNKFLNFFFPAYCLSCGDLNTWLCFKCQKKIISNEIQCFICKKNNKDASLCPWCKYISGERGRNFQIEAIYRYSNYQNLKLKNLIWAFKYSNLTDASFLLAHFLTQSLINLKNVWPINNSLLTCIPVNLKHKNTRGYNQARLLSLITADNLNIKFLDSLVMNKKREFRVINNNIANKNIILIDDVITSGETINQASIALKAQGAKKIYGLSLA